MHPRPSSAVYKCIIPVKNEKSVNTPSAIYHSLFREPREGELVLPFPAWPEVDDAYQPCCLPTLPKRGVYFHHHPISEKFFDVIKRAEEYVNNVVKPEIREQIAALIGSNTITLWSRLELGGLPQVILGNEKYFTFHLKLDVSAELVIEAFVQALVYGNLNNFFGVPFGDFSDVFAYVHKLSHHFAGWLHGGRILDKLSYSNHKTLHILATEERLSRGEVDKLWREFRHTNKQIETLVAKFEPIEEIFATYVGLHFLSTDIRQTVKSMIDEELKKGNWSKAYEAFAESCDNAQDTTPLHAASYLFDFGCSLVESNDIDSVSLLYELSNLNNINKRDGIDRFEAEAILMRAGVPAETLRAVSKAYKDWSPAYSWPEILIKAFICGPQVWLIGKYSEKIIHPDFNLDEPCCKLDSKDNLSLRDRIYYESIRQQLSKRYGFVSPFSHTQKTSDFKEETQRLYMRLPERYKRYFNLIK
jgi:hypothetical protein